MTFSNVVFVLYRDQNLAAILAAYFEVFSPFLEQCAIPFTLDQFIEEYQDRKVFDRSNKILLSYTILNSVTPRTYLVVVVIKFLVLRSVIIGSL
jgi:hypothetical protein